MPTLRIPSPLRPYANGQSEVTLQAQTVGEALSILTDRYAGLRAHLFTPDGQLRTFVNLFLNDEDVRQLQGLETPLGETDRLILIPSIAGGLC
jgi:molybdopterin converting factor small subunit